MNEFLNPNCELNCKFELREICCCHSSDWDAKSFVLRRLHKLPMPSTHTRKNTQGPTPATARLSVAAARLSVAAARLSVAVNDAKRRLRTLNAG